MYDAQVLITCVTDFSSTKAHSWVDTWAGSKSSQHYVVAGGPLLQQQAAQKGYPASHIIRTSGMVVHPRAANCR